jgi:hypothetical protein
VVIGLATVFAAGCGSGSSGESPLVGTWLTESCASIATDTWVRARYTFGPNGRVGSEPLTYGDSQCQTAAARVVEVAPLEMTYELMRDHPPLTEPDAVAVTLVWYEPIAGSPFAMMNYIETYVVIQNGTRLCTPYWYRFEAPAFYRDLTAPNGWLVNYDSCLRRQQ